MVRLSSNKMNITIIILMICTFYGCKEVNDCEDEILFIAEVFNVEKYIEIITAEKALHEKVLRNTFHIRSKDTYDNNVTGTCHPKIDFSKYDLVIGKQSTGNFNDTILYDYRRVCPNMELTLTVDVIQLDITMPSTVTYHALIPKLEDEESLNIKININ